MEQMDRRTGPSHARWGGGSGRGDELAGAQLAAWLGPVPVEPVAICSHFQAAPSWKAKAIGYGSSCVPSLRMTRGDRFGATALLGGSGSSFMGTHGRGILQEHGKSSS